jgi:Cytochrome P450
MYSFQDSDASAIIYGAQNVFPKSRWYFTFQQPEEPNIFSTHSNRFAADLRRKYKPAYDALYTYEYAVDDCTSILERKFHSFISQNQGSDVDLGWWLTCFAFDVNGEIAFSKRFGHLDEGKDIGNIATALAERLDYCASVGIYPSLHPWFWMLIKALAAVVKQIDYTLVFTQQRIDEHVRDSAHAKASRPVDMLTRLWDLHISDPKAFTQNDVLIGAYSTIVAGADTTWMSLGSVMHYLHKDPAKLAKLRDEIDSMATVGEISDPVTFDEAKKMPYLNAVIKESQRMHSPTGLPLWRTVPEGGAMLCGRFFSEGVSITCQADAVLADQALIDDGGRQYLGCSLLVCVLARS